MNHQLQALSSLVRLNDRIMRILGQNPGKFTLQGTNTYLVGERSPYTLIDTGEGRPGYIPLLESALQCRISGRGPEPGQQNVSDIIVSHWHPDHVGGLSSVLNLLRNLWEARNTTPFQPPRIHKFPHKGELDERFQHAVESVEQGLYEPSPSGSLFHDLRDGQTFPLTCADPSSNSNAIFQVIHSPGHTEDSISLLFPSDNVLYTADSILGHGTAIFEDLGTYISTLRLLLSYCDKDTTLYPAHGPVLQHGEQIISTYIQHRMEREEQIIQVLQQAPEGAPDESWSTWGIVSKVYAGYPQNLWEPAAGSVDQHLKKLESEGKVARLSGVGKYAQWQLLTKL